MGGRDETLGHDRIAFVVDLEASAVHEPRPSALDDPAFWEHLETAGVDAIYDFDADVVVAAVLDEGALEPRVTPQLGEASGAHAGTVRHGDATDVVRRARRHDDHGHKESEGANDAECLAPVDLLTSVKTFCFFAYRGRGADRAGIDDAGRWCALASLFLAHRRGQAFGDAFPGAVARPFEMVPMRRVPVRIAIGKGALLAARRRHVEDGVEHPAAVDFDRSAHRPRCPIRRDEIGDELPLLIDHVAMCRSPGLRHCNRVGFHGKTLLDCRPGWGLIIQ